MFQRVVVPTHTAEIFEQLGSKEKFWFTEKRLGQCLFKRTRVGTGDDWSEKIAAELAALLGLPHATYELATFRGQPGVITPTFVPRDGRLVLGNELLTKWVAGYPRPIEKRFRPRQHTLDLILAVLGFLTSSHALKPPISWMCAKPMSAADVFVGYVLLDAWIANQDRHHENWGLVAMPTGLHLAPTFDHASCLGTMETDATRVSRLKTRDLNYSMERYVARGTTAFFRNPSSDRPMGSLEAFTVAAKHRSMGASHWLDALSKINLTDVNAMMQNVPDDLMSEPSRDFALRMVVLNRDRLLALGT